MLAVKPVLPPPLPVALTFQVPSMVKGELVVLLELLPQPARTRAMPVRHRSRIPTDKEMREFMFMLLRFNEAFKPAVQFRFACILSSQGNRQRQQQSDRSEKNSQNDVSPHLKT
jgi:hypothetical protein